MNSIEVFRYAFHAASYLISGLSQNELKIVHSVVLFGSAARMTASEESDIDIFFDVNASRKVQLSMRAKLNNLAESFRLASAALEFRAKGIDNEISIKVGRLEEWEELAQSIASHGIFLYGKYSKEPPGLKPYTILCWEKPGKAKGTLLNKFYGYKAGVKKYPGLLKKFNGTKLGGSTILVPVKSRDSFIEALEKYKINYSRYDIWM